MAKTLQEQYNQIKKGKGSKAIFLKEVKAKYPSLVRNAAKFDEAASILSKRSIISENLYVANAQADPDWFKLFDKNMELISEEDAKALEKKMTKGVKDLQAPDKGYNYKDDKNINNVSGEQFRQGYFTELTDIANVDKTKQELIDLVIKNMSKNPQYYTEEAQFGIKGIGYTEDAPALGRGNEVKDSDSLGYGKETKKKLKKQDSSAYADKMSSTVFSTGYTDLAPTQPLEENKMISLLDILNESPLGEKPKVKKVKKAKKETTDSKLAEIEKNGKIATMELQIEALYEIIEGKNERISMVTEDDSLSELVDKTKMKEMQREVKILEKRKDKMEKVYEKMCGKAYKRQMDEDLGSSNYAGAANNDKSQEAFRNNADQEIAEESNAGSNENSNDNSNENSNDNKESYSGLSKFRTA